MPRSRPVTGASAGVTVRAFGLPVLTAALLGMSALAAGPVILGRRVHPAAPARAAWLLNVGKHYGRAANASGFSAIVLAGRRLWAFGGTNPGGASTPVAMVFSGASWQAAPLPGGLSGFISAAAATSPDNVWAVGGYGRYVLRWNGSQWQVARHWAGPGALSGLTAVSPRDVWVFGTSINGIRTVGTWRFTGNAWDTVRGIGGDIYRASAVSPRDIWAIAAGRTSDSIVHFTGRTWHRAPPVPGTPGTRWHDILAASSASIWVVGDAPSSGRLVFAHWNGRHWIVTGTRIDAWAGQLAPVPGGGVAASATTSGLLATGLIVQVSSHGTVSQSQIVSGLGSGASDVVYVPWSRKFWASGGYLTKLGGDAAVWVAPGQAAAPRAAPKAGTDTDGT